MTDYTTVEAIQGEMPDVEWSGKYNEQIALLITRASRLVDRYTGRGEGAFAVETATVRYFDGSGKRFQWVDEMAAAPTTVAVSDTGALTYTTWAATDYMLWPYNAATLGRPYIRLDIDQLNGNYAVWWKFPQSVKITAKWGYSTDVPAHVDQAVVIQTVRWFKRAQQGFQDVGAVFELGQLRYVKQLDPDVQLILDGYRRVTV
jgi:hypothetical protein